MTESMEKIAKLKLLTAEVIKINTTARIQDQNLTVAFTHQVTPSIALKVNLNEVKASLRREPIWLLPFLMRRTELSIKIRRHQ